jgi:lysophospholipase L1-like esterase
MFIGDSITTGFRIWQPHIKINGETLDNTVIFANGSYGIYNSLQEISNSSIHPQYDGAQIRPEDAVTAYGVSRVFISMGLNDVYLSLDSFLHNYALLLNRIREKNPDVELIILPVPPYMHDAQPTPDRNARISEYNNALIVLAHELGVSFIDSTAPLRDENGGLKPEFCGDPPPGGQGCHWVPSAYGEVLRFIAEHPAG